MNTYYKQYLYVYYYCFLKLDSETNISILSLRVGTNYLSCLIIIV